MKSHHKGEFGDMIHYLMGSMLCTKREKQDGQIRDPRKIEEFKRIKILGQEKHTSRGSNLMNTCLMHLFVHYILFACIAFVLILYMLVCKCLLVLRLEWCLI